MFNPGALWASPRLDGQGHPERGQPTVLSSRLQWVDMASQVLAVAFVERQVWKDVTTPDPLERSLGSFPGGGGGEMAAGGGTHTFLRVHWDVHWEL